MWFGHVIGGFEFTWEDGCELSEGGRGLVPECSVGVVGSGKVSGGDQSGVAVLLLMMGRMGESSGFDQSVLVPWVTALSSQETFFTLCGSRMEVSGSSGTCLDPLYSL